MAVEFHHLKCAGFVEHEYAIENNNRVEIEKLSLEKVDKYLLDISAKKEVVRRYIAFVSKRVTNHVEILRLCIRRFFGPLNNVPDIADDGSINIETAYPRQVSARSGESDNTSPPAFSGVI